MNKSTVDGANHKFTAPRGWESRGGPDMGPCGDLDVRVDFVGSTYTFTSAWVPTEAELDRLRAGKPVLLTIVGAQPPVALTVA